MSITYIHAPQESANDSEVKLVEWLIEDNCEIVEGQICLSLEGSKSIFDVEAPTTGILKQLESIGSQVQVGEPIALIYQQGDEQQVQTLLASLSTKTETEIPENFTEPAYALAQKHELVDYFSQQEFVNSNMVQHHVDHKLIKALSDRESSLTPAVNGRTLLIGAGKAAYQVMAVLSKDPNTEVIGFIDDTQEKQGLTHLGLPILGTINDLEEVLTNQSIDSILCSAGNQQLRRRSIELALKYKLTMANAIHPSAVLDPGVSIAGGNYIGPLCFIGADAKIGVGNFISSNNVIEHHCQVGSCNTTGPSVSLSGAVKIANFSTFGSGIIIQPSITLGNHVNLASGAIITKDIADYQSVKIRSNLNIRGSH
ncbi:hypothetical protein M0C34_07915 [Agarivorans sp. TSD2052]|uniref:biotin/lipoyl-containing protein n=1 Tax=Agarivorans sp. TSD2052 TaxID=2937286 RepID=UPI002010815E|nr:biotin/lipoyl-containing protein [Agarivorans sp. TSD2052]UPW20177.1 hypothetical protein M0C34_07915 [Agarivorans sp. TSD2052]